MDFVKHLETLGLEPGASPEEVRRAFRERMAAWRPERLPDNPSSRRDGERARSELEAAYRFLMNRYGLPPSDLGAEPTPPAAAEVVSPPTPRATPPKAPPKAPAEPRERVPVLRMVLVTGTVIAAAMLVVPVVRDGRLTRWTDAALEYSAARLADWFPAEGSGPAARPAGPGEASVQSLPRLTKSQVLQRYGEPHAREAGRWRYGGFAILFQDDSIASLLIRDSGTPN